MNPLCNNNCSDIFQNTTLLSSLLLFHYLLKSLSFCSNVAQSQSEGEPGFIWLNSFIFHILPPPVVSDTGVFWSLCPAPGYQCLLSEPLQGHLVSVSRPCTRSPGHAYFLYLIMAGKKLRRWLAHTSLPSLPPSSNPQGDGRE